LTCENHPVVLWQISNEAETQPMTNKALRIIFLLGFALSVWSTAHPQARLEGSPPSPPYSEAAGASQKPVVYEAGSHLLYLPITQAPTDWIDTTIREESRLLFHEEYEGTEGVDMDWTGDHATCHAGQTSEVFRTALLRRINYFRSMAGVPSIQGFDDTYNMKAQAAALMMSVNGELSHTPDPGWKCFTEAGLDGAGSSNLAMGMGAGIDAIQAYMSDDGDGNYFVGHRRWLLFPQTRVMGTGDIPSGDGYDSANALWVFDHNHLMDPRPTTRDEFVAWPPPGYVPDQVVYPRWSLAYSGADFSQATVAMKHGDQELDVLLQPPLDGFGENTLVWEPQIADSSWPGSDASYQVTVENVIVGGESRSFNYTVIVFQP
jgi:hypothetical protein